MLKLEFFYLGYIYKSDSGHALKLWHNIFAGSSKTAQTGKSRQLRFHEFVHQHGECNEMMKTWILGTCCCGLLKCLVSWYAKKNCLTCMIKNLPQSLMVMDRKWFFRLQPNEKDDLKNMEQNIDLQGKKWILNLIIFPCTPSKQKKLLIAWEWELSAN